jgi:hypothetical protein
VLIDLRHSKSGQSGPALVILSNLCVSDLQISDSPVHHSTFTVSIRLPGIIVESVFPTVTVMEFKTDHLMNLSDEMIWKQEGLFEKVDYYANSHSSHQLFPPVHSVPAKTPSAPVPLPQILTGASQVPFSQLLLLLLSGC